MKRFAHFSRHALKRISQRTSLDIFKISEILDYGGALDIGTEPVFDRKHWLFYSKRDDNFFIAVQDSLTGLIITVLPLEYHERLAWRVLASDLEKAKIKISNYRVSDAVIPKNLAPKVIILKARYCSSEGYAKNVVLNKIEAENYKGDILKLVSESSFYSEIIKYCRQKGVDSSKIIHIEITHGNKGQPLIIEWNIDDDHSYQFPNPLCPTH